VTFREKALLIWMALRNGDWLAGDRTRFIVYMSAFMTVPLVLVSFATYFEAGLTNGRGNLLGEDFVNYWMGAKFAWLGNGAEVYDSTVFMSALQDFAHLPLDFHNYSYPPSLMLITLPLAFLPFVWAFAVWTVAGGLTVFALVRSFWQTRPALLAMAAAPATYLNVTGGQNGALSAGFLGGGLLLLHRSPLIAGMLFGALSYKPHLGVLMPVALACGGHWRAFASAFVTVLLLVGISAGLFGWEAWTAYGERLVMMGGILDSGGLEFWQRMPTPYVAARLYGFERESALWLHFPVALYALSRVISVWRRSHELPSLKAAVLVLAMFLVTPYLWDYDMVVMIVIFAWRLHEGQLRAWEGSALALVMILPYLLIIAVNVLNFAIGPLVLVFALWVVSGRKFS